MADRQVPIFSARTGDFETQPLAAAGWAAHLLLRGCPGWPLLCSQLSAAYQQLITDWMSEALGFHTQRVANGRNLTTETSLQGNGGSGMPWSNLCTADPQPSSKQACRIRKSDNELGNLSIFVYMSGVSTLSQGIILVYLLQGSCIPVQHSLHVQGGADGVMVFCNGLFH